MTREVGSPPARELKSVTTRLVELGRLESRLNDELKSRMRNRKKRDLEVNEKRGAEDKKLKRRLLDRDNEEAELRQRKRKLESQLFGTTFLPEKESVMESEVESEDSTSAIDFTLKANSRPAWTSKIPTEWHIDDRGRPWYNRAWDGRLAYLECVDDECNVEIYHSKYEILRHTTNLTKESRNLRTMRGHALRERLASESRLGSEDTYIDED